MALGIEKYTSLAVGLGLYLRILCRACDNLLICLFELCHRVVVVVVVSLVVCRAVRQRFTTSLGGNGWSI